MHPAHHAKTHPGKAAYVMAYSGETVTYAELDARSNQGAHLFRQLGLRAGDAVALFLDNHPRYYEILWAAQRSGLRFTCLSSKLTAGEVEYIVRDCEAQGYPGFEDARAAMPATPIADESAGSAMLYSSGTTGRPKGVKRMAAVD